MRFIYLPLLVLLPSLGLCQPAATNLKTLEATASRYRMMTIACETDVKLDNKPLNQTRSCIELNKFIGTEYDALKSGLEKVEKDAKQQAESKGLQAEGLREKMILILSTRSHMQVGANVLKAVSK